MCFIVTLLLIGTTVLITTLSFGINPFKSNTTAFLSLSFFSLIGLGGVALMLNIAANLSLIAEGRSESQRASTTMFQSNKVIQIWAIATTSAAILAVIIIVGLDSASEERKFKLVEELANEVLEGNIKLIEKVADDLKSEEVVRLAAIPKKLEFLKMQRQDLPELLMIYSEDFEGQRAYRVINSWNVNPLIKDQKYPFYSCSKDIDCEQLKTFFEGGSLKKFSVKQKGLDEYSVYYPFELNSARFILLFNKGMRFGSGGKYE